MPLPEIAGQQACVNRVWPQAVKFSAPALDYTATVCRHVDANFNQHGAGDERVCRYCGVIVAIRSRCRVCRSALSRYLAENCRYGPCLPEQRQAALEVAMVVSEIMRRDAAPRSLPAPVSKFFERSISRCGRRSAL